MAEVDVTSMLTPKLDPQTPPRPLAASTRAVIRFDGGKDVPVLLEGFKGNLEGLQLTGMIKSDTVWDLLLLVFLGPRAEVLVLDDKDEEKSLVDQSGLTLSEVFCENASGKLVPVTIQFKRRG